MAIAANQFWASSAVANKQKDSRRIAVSPCFYGAPKRIKTLNQNRYSASPSSRRLAGCAAGTCPAATQKGRSPHAPVDGAL